MKSRVPVLAVQAARRFLQIACFLALTPTVFAQQTVDRVEASRELLEDLVATTQILFEEGILIDFGHVSVRHEGDSNRFLIARPVLDERIVTLEAIAEYDVEGNEYGTATANYGEHFIHGAIYRDRPDVNAVVHHHSPPLVVFGASSVPLRPMFENARFIPQSGLPIFDIREIPGTRRVLVQTLEQGRALTQALADASAVLMRSHGATVVGSSLADVVSRSIYLDLNARIQMQAIALGGTVTYLDPRHSSTPYTAVVGQFERRKLKYYRPVLR